MRSPDTSPTQTSLTRPGGRPMTVLMTTDTVGGVWTYTMELCAAFASMNVGIHLASMGRALSAHQQAQVAGLPHVVLHESDFRLCWMHEAWEDVRAAGEWLLNLEEQLQPDLVHLNDLAHGKLPWQSPVLMVGHSCVYSWHHAVKGTPPDEHWQRYRQTVSASIAAVDLLVAPSRAMLNSLLRFYGPVRHVAGASGQVIYNGRSSDPLANKRPVTAHKEDFILAGGRLWDQAKNIRSLALISRHLHWPLYVAGETREPGAQHERAMPEGPHYLGLLDQDTLFRLLNRASIYAAPAYYEPFGLGILEAAQAGCALVLGDIPSLRELWQDAAIFVPPDDPVAIGRQLNRLAERQQYRRDLGERAWRRAQQFSSERMAAEYLHRYQQMLAQHSASPTLGALT